MCSGVIGPWRTKEGIALKKRAIGYIGLVSAVGIPWGLVCCARYLMPFFTGNAAVELHMFLIPLLVCALCRCLPIEVREDEMLDLSVISVLAMYLVQGAEAAVAVYMLSTLLTFEASGQGKKPHHILNIGLQKVLFNDSTIVLSILLPDLVIRLLTGWAPGNLSLPGVIVPTALFSLLTFLTNGVLQLSMFCLNGMIGLPEMLHMLVGLTPNVIAAMPMGLLIAIGYSSSENMWIVFLMLFPLLLARYAWKLYLDSERARSRLIRAFINSIEAKDKYTQGHSERVAEYAVRIAREMKLSNRQIQLLRQGAVLHDIGKIGIADQILNKPGELDKEEMACIQHHPLIGMQILKEVGLEDEVLELVRSHHERYDGLGYPDKRPAKELSLPTRILCVADAYDAMTSDRPYRKGMGNEKVFSILRECKGTQFDPDVVEALIRSMEK